MPSSPLRVLQVCQPTTGGAAVCVRQLAEAAVAEDVAMAVACPEQGELAEWVRDLGVTHVPVPLTREPEPADLLRIADLRRLFRTADVVHLHSSKAGADGRMALPTMPRRPGCVFTPHGWSWLVGGPLVPIAERIEWLLAPVADAIVAVSDEEAQAGQAVLGRRANLVVIPNGVDAQRFRPQGGRAARAVEPLVVCVGRLHRAKGQDLAVLAMAQLPGVRLRLVGDGPERPALERLVHEVGVADRVEFVGAVADTGAHLRAADVVVLPSRWEGLSLVQLEAMACGAAIVATRVPGASLLDGAGVQVDPGDPAALAQGIRGLLAGPHRRAALGAAARQVVVERFSLARTTSANIALWHTVARRRSVT